MQSHHHTYDANAFPLHNAFMDVHYAFMFDPSTIHAHYQQGLNLLQERLKRAPDLQEEVDGHSFLDALLGARQLGISTMAHHAANNNEEDRQTLLDALSYVQFCTCALDALNAARQRRKNATVGYVPATNARYRADDGTPHGFRACWAQNRSRPHAR